MFLEINNLRKVFSRGWLESRSGHPEAEVTAVRQVSFSIDQGEIFGLVGESGSGKSTLANCILGLETPTEGEILFKGRPLSGANRAGLRGCFQAVFQDPEGSLNPHMTVEQIIREPLDILKRDQKAVRLQRVLDVMNRVGLPADLRWERPARLSGGQKQRVAIARALVADPELLVADEPVSALDASVQAQILNLLVSLRESSELTILLISHDLNVVGQLCDRAAVMVRGALVEIAPVDRLFNSPQHPYTQSLLASIVPLAPAAASLWAEKEIVAWEGNPGQLREVAPGHWVAA